jgi:hypothetical protein
MSSSTEVEDLTNNPKAGEFSPAIGTKRENCTGIWLQLAGRENMERIWREYGENMERIWREYGENMVKKLYQNMAVPSSTEVEYLNHYPKMKGSNPGESSALIA